MQEIARGDVVDRGVAELMPGDVEAPVSEKPITETSHQTTTSVTTPSAV
jgi:hypothetical protein